MLFISGKIVANDSHFYLHVTKFYVISPVCCISIFPSIFYTLYFHLYFTPWHLVFKYAQYMEEYFFFRESVIIISSTYTDELLRFYISIGSEAVIAKILRFYDRSNKHIRYSEVLQHIFNYYPIETFDNARYFGKLLQTYVEKKKESESLDSYSLSEENTKYRTFCHLGTFDFSLSHIRYNAPLIENKC